MIEFDADQTPAERLADALDAAGFYSDVKMLGRTINAVRRSTVFDEGSLNDNDFCICVMTFGNAETNLAGITRTINGVIIVTGTKQTGTAKYANALALSISNYLDTNEQLSCVINNVLSSGVSAPVILDSGRPVFEINYTMQTEPV